MRFRRWPRPTAYRETSRKRAAFLRKQRLEREALPLFAAQIDARQHGIDEEMARRAIWWVDYERDRRDQRAARWRSEEHTSELQSLMRHSYAVFCLKKKKQNEPIKQAHRHS